MRVLMTSVDQARSLYDLTFASFIISKSVVEI